MLKLRGLSLPTMARAAWVGGRSVGEIRHVFVCVADHFEPDWRGATPEVQLQRVERWLRAYPQCFAHLQDSRGRAPQHTFFYPIEVYQHHLVERLCGLVREGWADIEIHLHHDADHSDRLRKFLTEAAQRLHRDHGLLSKSLAGELRYGFIHGNWALDNSHPSGRWCGVNDELSILRETGCYGDFTMPAAPHAAQTRTINGIYYATDDRRRPKSHDRGTAASLHRQPDHEQLLLIQGPLLLSWRSGRFRPRLENGNMSASQKPRSHRIQDWLRARVTVDGREDWRFVKLHTHGAPETNADVLLGPAMLELHEGWQRFAARLGFEYYYVTAREMAQLVAQAEQGMANPDFDNLQHVR